MPEGGELATFSRPPVTEVAVGVSFKYLEGLSIPLIGDLWRSRFAKHFPKVEEHPQYVPPVEQLESPVMGSPISIQLGQAAVLPRLWFINEPAGDELLQLQRNWFACNWRKVAPDAEYGRWPNRRQAFERWFGEFSAFVKENGLGDPSPLQCEVTYVNHVGATGQWRVHAEPGGFFRLAGQAEGRFLSAPEQMQVGAQYLITGDDRERVGRLHVSIQPGLTIERQEPIYVLTLTARGIPDGPGIAGILGFMDRGREWIVRGFVDLITPAAREEWDLHE